VVGGNDTVRDLLTKIDGIMALGGYVKGPPDDDEQIGGEWRGGHLSAAHGEFLAEGWDVSDGEPDMGDPPPESVARFPGEESLEVFLWSDGTAIAYITDLGTDDD
jgi:hypothetical protein